MAVGFARARSADSGALPSVPGIVASCAYRGAGREAGSDWIDTFVLPDGRLALSIGDVTAGSARQAVNAVRAALRDAAGRCAPLGALRQANGALAKLRSGATLTAIFGVLDPATLAFTYACAGHPPPAAALPDGTVAELPGRGTGIPLGVFTHLPAVEMATRLEPGSLLALCTNGFIECSRGGLDGEAAFAAALAAAAARASHDPARDVADALFGARAPRRDAALLVLELTPALERVDVQLPAVPASAPLARAALRRFVHGAGLPAGRAFEVILAAGEAVANAIEHAYAGSAGAQPRFALRAHRLKRRIDVVIEDYGTWRSSEKSLERGRGLELMYALADRFAIEETRGGTRVRMTFALDGTRART